jgi:hypothetical protein
VVSLAPGFPLTLVFHSKLYLLFNSTLPVWTWKSRKRVHDRSCLPVPLGTCARPNLRNAHLIHQSILSRHNIQRRFRKNGQFELRSLQNQGLLPVPNPTADTLLVRVKKMSWSGPLPGPAPFQAPPYPNGQLGYGQHQAYQYGQQPPFSQYQQGPAHAGQPQRPQDNR